MFFFSKIKYDCYSYGVVYCFICSFIEDKIKYEMKIIFCKWKEWSGGVCYGCGDLEEIVGVDFFYVI